MEASLEVEQLLRATLRPALGCTEPVAIAYAVAAAVQAPMGWLPEKAGASACVLAEPDIERVRVSVNRNVFKNAFSITIPNTGMDNYHALVATRSWSWARSFRITGSSG